MFQPDGFLPFCKDVKFFLGAYLQSPSRYKKKAVAAASSREIK
jgi:hypothetical protein